MAHESEMRELFDRWFTHVWQEGRYDLIPSFLAPVYTRHGSIIQSGFTVTYTPEEYSRVLVAERERFHPQWVIHDRAFVGDRAWFRLTYIRTDPVTGRQLTSAGMQVYRIEGGRLAETWVAAHTVGSTWPEDTTAEGTDGSAN